MRLRSAIVRRTGDCTLTATVCPTSTLAVDDDAVDRRADDRVIQSELRLANERPRRLDVGLLRFHIAAGLLPRELQPTVNVEKADLRRTDPGSPFCSRQ